MDNVDDNTSQSKSFEYKTKITGKKPARPTQPPKPPVPALNAEVTISLKYLRNFWRSLEMSLINCEVQFDLSWTKDCVLMEHQNNITGVNFMITSTKLYVPVVTFDQPVKKKSKSVWKTDDYNSRNDDYTTGNLLDFLYYQIIINSLV